MSEKNKAYMAAIQAIAGKKYLMAVQDGVKKSQFEIDKFYDIAEKRGLVVYETQGRYELEINGKHSDFFETEIDVLMRMAEILA